MVKIPEVFPDVCRQFIQPDTPNSVCNDLFFKIMTYCGICETSRMMGLNWHFYRIILRSHLWRWQSGNPDEHDLFRRWIETSTVKQSIEEALAWFELSRCRAIKKEPFMIKEVSGHRKLVTCVAPTSDGGFATGSADGTARLWNADGRCTGKLKGHVSWIRALAVMQPSGRFVTASDDGTARVWSSRGQLMRVLKGHEDWVLSTTVTTKGCIVTSSTDGSVCMWSSDGLFLTTLSGHEGAVPCVMARRNGGVATCSADATVRLWDAEGNLERVHQGHVSIIWCLTETLAGEIVSGSEDHTIRLWSLDGERVTVFSGHEGAILCLDRTPQGDIVSGSADHKVCLWSTESGTLKMTLSGHSSWILCLMVKKDGNILTGGGDGMVCSWSPEGQLRAKLRSCTRAIWCVTVLSGGEIVAGGGAGGAMDPTDKWVTKTGSYRHRISVWKADGKRLGAIPSLEIQRRLKMTKV